MTWEHFKSRGLALRKINSNQSWHVFGPTSDIRPKFPVFNNNKNTRHAKKQKSVTIIWEGCGEAVNRNTLIGPDVEVGQGFQSSCYKCV